MQLFIAVINENFDVAEEAKKGQQASKYWEETQRPTAGHSSWMRKFNPYRWIRANPVEVKVEGLPSNLALPMQKSLVDDYRVPHHDSASFVTVRNKPSINAFLTRHRAGRRELDPAITRTSR